MEKKSASARNERKWKKLLKSIREQRCILMLGPRMNIAEQEEASLPFIEAFSTHLCKELKTEGVEVEPTAERNLPFVSQLFTNLEDVDRIDIEEELTLFYKNIPAEVPELYKQLARLPISIVIDTGFDHYMEKAFNSLGKFCLPLHYNFKRSGEQALNQKNFSPQTPLVYKLFGAVADPESLVITDQDQMEFIKNVVKGDPAIPEVILQHFDDKKNYLFLGFDIEHWQFRLLLESLNLKAGNTAHSPKVKAYEVSTATKKLFEHHFNFHFERDSVADFVQKISVAQKENPVEEKEAVRKRKKIFIAYSDKDLEDTRMLADFLNPYQDKIELFYKEKIAGGGQVDKIIREKLEEAELILLMISVDFLNELMADPAVFDLIIKKKTTESAIVTPVLIRPCDWKAIGEFAEMASLPTNGEALNSPAWSSKDQAFMEITEKLKKMLL